VKLIEGTQSFSSSDLQVKNTAGWDETRVDREGKRQQ